VAARLEKPRRESGWTSNGTKYAHTTSCQAARLLKEAEGVRNNIDIAWGPFRPTRLIGVRGRVRPLSYSPKKFKRLRSLTRCISAPWSHTGKEQVPDPCCSSWRLTPYAP